MSLVEVFGLVLRKKCLEREISQEQLALKSGLDRTFISMLERGVRQPTLSTIFTLCKVLRVPPSTLILEVERKTRRSRLHRTGSIGGD